MRCLFSLCCLLALVLITNAQKTEKFVLAAIKKSAGTIKCYTDASEFAKESQQTKDEALIKRLSLKSDENLSIQFNCKSKQEAINERGHIELFPLQGSPLNATAKDTALVFELENPLAGVKNGQRYFQFKYDKKCSSIIVLSLDSTPDNTSAGAYASPLSLDVPVNAIAVPCASCVNTDNVLVYDFGANTVRYVFNKKKAGTAEIPINRLSFRRPFVGNGFVFRIKNVNALLYDVTVTDEKKSFNQDLPPLIDAAFTPDPTIKAAGASGKRDNLKADIIKLGTELDKAIEKLQRAGECTDICESINKVVAQVNQYFHDNYNFDNSEGLEAWVVRTLGLNNKPADSADSASIAKLKDILNKYFSFRTTYSNFSYKIPQVQNVDQYVFKVNILPKTGISGVSKVLNQDIAIDVLRGFRVDASTGLFVTKLADRRYTLLPDSTVIRNSYGADSIVFNRRKRVVEDTTGAWDFGVASLVHFYCRLTNGVNIAASLGAGVTVSSSPKLRYLGGFSLLLGKENRISLTAGWAAGFIEKLSDRYAYQNQNGNIYTSNSESSIVTKKTFATKGFYSITYNIPLMKKKETPKASVDTSGDATGQAPPTKKSSDENTQQKKDDDASSKDPKNKKG